MLLDTQRLMSEDRGWTGDAAAGSEADAISLRHVMIHRKPKSRLWSSHTASSVNNGSTSMQWLQVC